MYICICVCNIARWLPCVFVCECMLFVCNKRWVYSISTPCRSCPKSDHRPALPLRRSSVPFSWWCCPRWTGPHHCTAGTLPGRVRRLWWECRIKCVCPIPIVRWKKINKKNQLTFDVLLERFRHHGFGTLNVLVLAIASIQAYNTNKSKYTFIIWPNYHQHDSTHPAAIPFVSALRCRRESRMYRWT